MEDFNNISENENNSAVNSERNYQSREATDHAASASDFQQETNYRQTTYNGTMNPATQHYDEQVQESSGTNQYYGQAPAQSYSGYNANAYNGNYSGMNYRQPGVYSQNRYPGHTTPPSAPTATVQAQKTKKHSIGKIIALVTCCSILSAGVGAGTAALVSNSAKSSHSSGTTLNVGTHEDTTISVNSIESGSLMSAAEVYAKNANATVGITTSITTNYFGWTTSSAASGSGFIISEDGYILTNYHVVEDSNSITVTAYDGTKYEASIVGVDESNDLAVLKIDATGLDCVTLGNSDKLNVGDDVVAIGNPLGELTFSLTKGAVSALNRDITISTGYSMKLIQTDCAINSGNSGGALFNMYGEVIGITNAKYSGSSSSSASIDNIGFAIPINSVIDIVKGIIETGTITKNDIGVSLQDYSTGFGFTASSYAYVTAVESDSNAEEAGIQKGDIILKVNGTEVSGASEVISIIQGVENGEEVTLTIYRNGQSQDVSVTVSTKEVSALPDASSSNDSDFGGYGFSYSF